jgi:hypothetical protein
MISTRLFKLPWVLMLIADPGSCLPLCLIERMTHQSRLHGPNNVKARTESCVKCASLHKLAFWLHRPWSILQLGSFLELYCVLGWATIIVQMGFMVNLLEQVMSLILSNLSEVLSFLLLVIHLSCMLWCLKHATLLGGTECVLGMLQYISCKDHNSACRKRHTLDCR